ncbi:MAG TPA: hypothetical protein VMF52_16410 [Steroidobacteraceae bacterium]|nr:hypothetical protein [Steroidobacteraceae bacterium]
MRSHIHRPGLSFEVAPPRRSHPNRTDIACFVGACARRRDVAVRRPLPEVLARWVEGQPVFRAEVARDGTRLRRAVVALDSVAAFRTTLQAALDTDAWPAPVDTAALTRLLTACRELSPVPVPLVESLRVAGFAPGSLLGVPSSADPLVRSRAELEGWTRVQRLLNLPIRCENFETFADLFDWDGRALHPPGEEVESLTIATPLGAALRAYFSGGGRTAHVVVTGEPVPVFALAAERYAVLAAEVRESATASFDLSTRVPVLPGTPAALPAAVVTPGPVSTDPAAWRGAEHVFGLPDVSFVVLPDLVDAIAIDLPQIVERAEILVTPEVFQECVERPSPPRLPAGRRVAAPTLGARELAAWRRLLSFARALLDNDPHAFNRRDTQLLASLPLPAAESGLPKQNDWPAWLDADPAVDLQSERIQLAWPWLRTPESGDCQGGIEAPEGSLAAALAGSALRAGSFHSAARFPVDRLIDVEPRLDLGQALTEAAVTALGDFTLADRVCLIAPTPRGPELVSDVTLAADPLLRAGAVRRLVNVVIAQARQIGEDLLFEPNGEALWEQIVSRLNDLGRLLVAVGAVSSDAGADAFVARCGRKTMTQNDIDAGRTLVEIELVPSQPIVRIVVVLDLRDASTASVTDATARAA